MRPILFIVLLLINPSSLTLAQERPAYKPNPKLTPGAALALSREDLCQPGKTDLDANIPVAVKGQVFDRYGLSATAIGYNVDHLIPVGLGGSNSIKNLWPQPLSGEWTYAMKNKLEHRLRKLVCSGALDLKLAQQEIVADWPSAYKKYIGAPGSSRSNR